LGKGENKLNNIKKYDNIYQDERIKRRGGKVTVCVAALCENSGIVICASDRMLTSPPDIEFEPPQSKIVPLTNSIVAMCAGDSSVQSEIIQKVRTDINGRIRAEPDNWWRISDTIDLYAKYYYEKKRKIGETRYLSPFNLNHSTFIANQHNMKDDFVGQLSSKLLGIEDLGVQAIFAGIDTSGGHIYGFINEQVLCFDSVGFASIGIGARHASSELMFSGHVSTKLFPETIILVYSAKKRSEVAPGVGQETDLYLLGPGLGKYYIPQKGDVLCNKLEDIFKKAQRRIKEANIKANKEISGFMKESMKAVEGQKSQEETRAEIKPAIEN
jgi:20S proteasome alpha/beta subunit